MPASILSIFSQKIAYKNANMYAKNCDVMGTSTPFYIQLKKKDKVQFKKDNVQFHKNKHQFQKDKH